MWGGSKSLPPIAVLNDASTVTRCTRPECGTAISLYLFRLTYMQPAQYQIHLLDVVAMPMHNIRQIYILNSMDSDWSKTSCRPKCSLLCPEATKKDHNYGKHLSPARLLAHFECVSATLRWWSQSPLCPLQREESRTRTGAYRSMQTNLLDELLRGSPYLSNEVLEVFRHCLGGCCIGQSNLDSGVKFT